MYVFIKKISSYAGVLLRSIMFVILTPALFFVIFTLVPLAMFIKEIYQNPTIETFNEHQLQLWIPLVINTILIPICAITGDEKGQIVICCINVAIIFTISCVIIGIGIGMFNSSKDGDLILYSIALIISTFHLYLL